MNVFYAPNVHTGGGLKLLNSLLSQSASWRDIILDERSKSRVSVAVSKDANFYLPTIVGRFQAELKLYRVEERSHVLCFHSLPPLLPFKGKVSVFFQNVTILDSRELAGWNIRVRIRSLVERCVFLLFKKRVDQYYVQTDSVKQLLVGRGGVSPNKISILPFSSLEEITSPISQVERKGFVYVADGISHKNHYNLVKAWVLLAESGNYPVLKLTLGERDKLLWEKLKVVFDKKNLNIQNIGHVPYSEIKELYKSSEALIFPSLKESFGLPLIEAESYHLPVIAPELDYVRDVCSPVETFDPLSPRSISRAVERFKGWKNIRRKVLSPKEFLHRVFLNKPGI